ncbi:MAG: hypothetical protein DRQ47_01370 [Gammaproteobacteria bacterium]|nr:MAG: hypothetical protein DRQ47_01370 [Gammaproteobacteria bacterium]
MAEIEEKIIGPGPLLAAARKKAKRSIDDIANLLNLAPNLIEELETDQYNDDIPDAFLRGYLRTYARAVALDEEQIVTLYSQLRGTSSVTNYYVPSNDIQPVKTQIGSHMLWFKILSYAVVVAILVLGWFAYTTNDKQVQELPEASQTKAAQTPTASVTTSGVAKQQSPQQQPQKQQPVAEAEVEQSFEIADSSNAELEFKFNDDCWVQVSDNNKEILAVGLKSSGRRFSVSGVPPIKIVLGKPRAVTILYNNKPVDLTPYPGSQTARFTLGDTGAINQDTVDQ